MKTIYTSRIEKENIQGNNIPLSNSGHYFTIYWCLEDGKWILECGDIIAATSMVNYVESCCDIDENAEAIQAEVDKIVLTHGEITAVMGFEALELAIQWGWAVWEDFYSTNDEEIGDLF